MHWRRKWQPTPVFSPGESQGWGAWWAAIYGVAQSWTQLKRLVREGNGNPLQCSCLENPRDGEPGGLPSMGSQRVGLNRTWLLLAVPAPLKGLHNLHHHSKIPCSFSFTPLVPNSGLGLQDPIDRAKGSCPYIGCKEHQEGKSASFIHRWAG